jgi:hypothetical protein
MGTPNGHTITGTPNMVASHWTDTIDTQWIAFILLLLVIGLATLVANIYKQVTLPFLTLT